MSRRESRPGVLRGGTSWTLRSHAAVASLAVFVFLFVPSQLTFAVADSRSLVRFVVMLVVGILEEPA